MTPTNLPSKGTLVLYQNQGMSGDGYLGNLGIVDEATEDLISLPRVLRLYFRGRVEWEEGVRARLNPADTRTTIMQDQETTRYLLARGYTSSDINRAREVLGGEEWTRPPPTNI